MEPNELINKILTPEFKKILENLNKEEPGSKDKNYKSIELKSVPPSSFSILALAIFQKLKNYKIIVVSSNNSNCEQLLQECQLFQPKAQVIYYPEWEVLPYSGMTPDRELIRERINGLYHLSDEKPCVAFTSIGALVRKIAPPEHLKGQGLHFQVGDDYQFEEILERLFRIGYKRENMVESFGQFSQRGDIIDIFSPSKEYPVRLHFFGEELEKISEFDPLTQLSFQDLGEFRILPKREILPSEEDKKKIESWAKKYIHNKKKNDKLNQDEKKLDEDGFWSDFQQKHIIDSEYGFEDFLPAFLDGVSISSVTGSNTVYLFANIEEINVRWEQIYREYKDLYDENKNSFPCFEPKKLLFSKEEVQDFCRPSFLLSLISRHDKENLTIDLGIKLPPAFQGQFQRFRESLELWIDNGIKVFLSSPFEAQLIRLRELLKNYPTKIIDYSENKKKKVAKTSPKKPSKKNKITGNESIFLVLSHFKQGFQLDEKKLILLTDFEIFGRSYRRKTQFKRKKSEPISSFLDIKPGDYVVHINHGIGRFRELNRVTAGGKERDFLIIEYAKEDTLYVPLDQISLVQRYIGSGEENVKLDNLGKNAWQKVKERVKANIQELAKELIQIYAARKKLKGYSFNEDTIWQEEFEARFGYEETPDQIQAIEDTKKDMESNRPMDRLICGDVGFGKTEVAIRAAFKASMSGKQTAFLVPTTILCMQHFKTLEERFEGYPIQVAMISRFVTNAKINEIKAKLAKGEIDIVVGTHALLNPDVKFRNLGLVIIDEEQRFGVKHKERLKKYRILVDVLTLTATPIPRTLHMSLAKIRDIAVINTPPLGRKAIETYIMEDNPEILKKAINRELDREGQVFYIHNRVETIEFAFEFLIDLAPGARIAIAHGQLPKHELEDVMLEFINKKIDILVCTTIVESGLDIPTVNTLIVNRADTFGLSQLYQLKGRVGRSGIKAFAYFFYPANRSLTEIAQKRLQVIHEYSDLGSGFKVAMRDLEIRGAGNILGAQQSGDIIEVGYELYMKLLDETVNKLSGKEIEFLEKPILNLKTNYYIPDDYIPDTKQKIEIYKKLEGALDLDEIQSIQEECFDRYGRPSEPMRVLLLNEIIRVLSTKMQIENISEHEKGFLLRPGSKVKIAPMSILRLLERDPLCRLSGRKNEMLEIQIPKNEKIIEENRLKRLKSVLQELYNFS